MERISYKGVVESCARITAGSSIILRADSSLKELEGVAFMEFDHRQQAEILIGEIFISQIPLSMFLGDKGQADLITHYYLCLFELMNDKKFFSRGDLTPEQFELMLQSRYVEYYELVQKDEFYTQSVAKATTSHISRDGAGLLPMGLTSIYNASLLGVNTLLKGLGA